MDTFKKYLTIFVIPGNEFEFQGKSCLVTGGAGFIGSNLSRHLANLGAKVLVIDDFSMGRKENTADFENLGITLVNFDISDQKNTKKFFSDIDFVFHQAAIASVPKSIKEPILTNSSNLKGTLSVLENSRLQSVKKVVFAASASAYGDTEILPISESFPPSPLSPYAVEKLASEMYCKTYFDNYGLSTTSLRYFNVYGPYQDPNSEYSAVIPIFIKNALKNKTITIFGDGQTTRDFVFVDDVVQANLQAALYSESDGFVINIAYGKSVTLTKLAEYIINKTKSDSGIVYEPFRKGDVLESLADLSQAKKLLKYNPQFDLLSGLEKTIQFFAQ